MQRHISAVVEGHGDAATLHILRHLSDDLNVLARLVRSGCIGCELNNRGPGVVYRHRPCVGTSQCVTGTVINSRTTDRVK